VRVLPVVLTVDQTIGWVRPRRHDRRGI